MGISSQLVVFSSLLSHIYGSRCWPHQMSLDLDQSMRPFDHLKIIYQMELYLLFLIFTFMKFKYLRNCQQIKRTIQ